MESVVSIELGTNAVRVCAFDLKGNIIAFAKGTYPTFHPVADYSEQDPEQIFITMLYVLKNLLNDKIHPKKYKVLSLCFSASMHSLLAIDKNGVPLGNVITWADNRGKKEAAILRASAQAASIYSKTGTPIHPMSPLVKITWMQKNDPAKFASTYKFLTIKSYIIQQLTGQYVIDYSLASATGLLNIRNKKWEAEALAYAGINAAQLPDLVPIAQPAGNLRHPYRVSLGLGADTKILTGSSDGCFATLGASVWQSDMATVTIEDSAAVRVVGKKILDDKNQRLFNYVLDDEYYISGGPSNNGGVVFEWFAKQFGEFKQAYDLENCMQELFADAANVPAGADGLLFLPYLLGERAPLWNANARGVYFGANINHSNNHFIRATIEGILYEVCSIARLLKNHRNITSLSVNGSFAANPLCAQLLTDMLAMPVTVTKNVSSVSLGAYLLSATELGVFATLEQAAQSIPPGNQLLPNAHNTRIYQQYHPFFEALSQKLLPDFETLNQLTASVQRHEAQLQAPETV